MCTETITVFNRVVDANGYDSYIPCVIKGVSWFNRVGTSVDTTGLRATDSTVIRVPLNADFSGRSYLSPSEYCGDADTFTLKQGDIIVHAACTERGMTPATLQERYGQVVVIHSVTDDRRGGAPHWKVTGS